MGIFRPRAIARFAELPEQPVDEPTVELTPLDTGERAKLLDVRLILLEHPPLPDDYPALRPSVPVIPGRAA